jgi:trk system potassium uptake protein TrkH
MVRVLAVLNVLSVLIAAFALCMLVPLGFSFLLHDAAQASFGKALFATGLAAVLLWAATRGHRRELQPRDGFLLVSLVWTVLPAFAALPLLLSIPGLSVTGAYFEAVSGLTASGGTILSGLDKLPASINIWRTFLVWLGGMGIIVLAVAILPLLGVGGSQIYRAETPGPMKDTKLTPRITETAKGLWLVYVFITITCLLCFRMAGMNWLDAMMHSFTTMGLGGFSSHDASFAYWNSPAIEAVAIVFMLAAGINFGTHFLAWRRRSFACYVRDPEAGLYLFVVIASVFAIAWFLLAHHTYDNYWTALRFAAFNVVSLATTTGYSNTDYNLWPVFAPVWMLFLCCFCTCSGSTGSGIKMIRFELMLRQAVREMTRIIHPRALVPVKLGGEPVENNIIFAVLAFMLMYGGSIVAMTMLLAASGLDIITSFSAVVVCINNAGPGLGHVGPASTYAVLNEFQVWICTFAMLLGRLELFTLLVLFTPGFWRK